MDVTSYKKPEYFPQSGVELGRLDDERVLNEGAGWESIPLFERLKIYQHTPPA